MVLPVTGPFNETVSTREVYKDKRKWKQAKPIDRPLEYFLDYAFRRSFTGDSNNLPFPSGLFGSATGAPIPNTQNAYQPEITQAYGRLVGEVTNNAQLGATLAEGHQSIRMMTQRFVQLADFTKRLRRLDFVGAARVVNLAIVPKGVSAKRSLANNWLEYSFGWKPLIQDIYSAVDHLQNPINSITPKGRAKSTHNVRIESGRPTDAVYSLDTSLGIRYAKIGCEITINNPNLYLANKLGLANPASVIWELIPFSFVVDWFATVGEFLASGTDFLGLTVSKPWSVYGYKGQCQMIRKSIFLVPPVSTGVYPGAHMRREQSLLGPSLFVRPFRLFGWQRCANAASVLTQLLSKR